MLVILLIASLQLDPQEPPCIGLKDFQLVLTGNFQFFNSPREFLKPRHSTGAAVRIIRGKNNPVRVKHLGPAGKRRNARVDRRVMVYHVEVVHNRSGQEDPHLLTHFLIVGPDHPLGIEGNHRAQVMAHQLQGRVLLQDTRKNQARKGQRGLKGPTEHVIKVIILFVSPPFPRRRVQGVNEYSRVQPGRPFKERKEFKGCPAVCR